METLTDLEAAALGCIFRRQPCTAHFIRTRFRESPSARFSDSAGSVYPMVKRLHQRGLASTQLRQEGQRQVQYYSCTATGRAALRRWIGPPIDAGATVTIDPLRTRLLHLSVLTPRQRSTWLAEAERLLREQLQAIEAKLKNPDDGCETGEDPFYRLAHENARMETQARIKWLRLAKKELSQLGLSRE